MVRHIRIEEALEFDDDFNPVGLSILKPDARYDTVQDLLATWIQDVTDEGFEDFIHSYELDGILKPQDLKRLYIHPELRLGKNLAGILSLLIPPEIGSWQLVKNIYDTGGSSKAEVDITRTEAKKWLDRFEPESVGEAVRLHRRSQLRTMREVARIVGVHPTLMNKYETGIVFPSVENIKKIAHDLHMDDRMQHLLISAAEDKEWDRLSRLPEPIISEESSFGDLLKSHRIQNRMTRAKMANIMDTDISTVRRHESGERYPSTVMIHRYADILGITKHQRLQMLEAVGNGTNSQSENSHFENVMGGKCLFGAMVNHLLARFDSTAKDLSALISLPEPLLSKYLKGDKIPTTKHVDTIADALQVSNDERKALHYVAEEQLKTADAHRQLKIAATSLTRPTINFDQPFNRVLQECREREHFTSTSLSRAAKIDVHMLSKYEAGKALPGDNLSHKLAKVLKLDAVETQSFILSLEQTRSVQHGR